MLVVTNSKVSQRRLNCRRGKMEVAMSMMEKKILMTRLVRILFVTYGKYNHRYCWVRRSSNKTRLRSKVFSLGNFLDLKRLLLPFLFPCSLIL